VDALKVARFGWPASITPDDFRGEVAGAESVIELDANVVYGAPIEVHHE
jgi:hypothetical protein